MKADEILEQLKQELKPILDELDAEIVEFNLYRASKKIILRLLVDKEGGINMGECAFVNKRLGNIIEEKSIINENYMLEVNSPGMDRPLKVKRDFEKVKPEEEVDFWLRNPLEDKAYLSGRIKTSEDDKVVIVDKDGKEISILYDMIAKAKIRI